MILIAKMLLNPPNTLRLAWHGSAETTLFTSGTHLMFLIPKMLLNHPNPLRLSKHHSPVVPVPVPVLLDFLLSVGPGYTTYFPQELCSTWMQNESDLKSDDT